MRLLKRQTTNLRSIAGKGVQYDINDQVIVDSSNSMRLPTGNTASRPGESGVVTGASSGQIRYNTTTDELESFQDGEWRNLRFKEPNRNPGIIWQNLGVGDAVETVFGELNSQDTEYPVPADSKNILVLIENVLQIPVTNYNIRQTSEITTGGAHEGPNAPYTATGTGWWIQFTSEVPLGKPITIVHNFDK